MDTPTSKLDPPMWRGQPLGSNNIGMYLPHQEDYAP